MAPMSRDPTPPAHAPRHSAAAARNQGAILTELLRRLPAQGQALEIASGTGQHVVHFAAALPGWRWQPTDLDPQSLHDVARRVADTGLRNVLPPARLDLLGLASTQAGELPPGADRVDLVFSANLLHIAPWAACGALMRLAGARLAEGGRLIVYGPFRVADEALADGNRAFDADLRARNPAWGLRWLHEVDAQAQAAGLARAERVNMPANNLLLVYQRAAAGPAHRVRLQPVGVTLTAPPGSTLLAAALAAGWRLPHACRNGTCRACRCQVESGSVRYVVDWPGLSAEERSDAWTLPCVAVPTSDVVLNAPLARSTSGP